MAVEAVSTNDKIESSGFKRRTLASPKSRLTEGIDQLQNFLSPTGRCEDNGSIARDRGYGTKAPSPLATFRKPERHSLSLAFLLLLTFVCSTSPGSAQDAPSAKQ